MGENGDRGDSPCGRIVVGRSGPLASSQSQAPSPTQSCIYSSRTLLTPPSQIAKVTAMQAQYRRWERENPLDPELKKRLQKEGAVKGLGLLEKPVEKKAIGSVV